MTKPLQEGFNVAGLAQSFAEIPAMIKKNETFCLKMCQEVLATKTESFERIDSHFVVDGLQATYKCNLDGRVYTVKITPSKG